MNYQLDTLIWAAALLAAGVGLYLIAMALRRWIRRGENLGVLAPELATQGTVYSDAFLKQRQLLGADLAGSATELPKHEREIVHHALWHAMLLEAASDGTIDAREVRFVSEFFGTLSGHKLARDTAIETAETIAGHPQRALAEIAKARNASQAAREHILEGAFLVSLADGELIRSEANRLGDIADALGFSLDERQQIYEAMTRRQEDGKSVQ